MSVFTQLGRSQAPALALLPPSFFSLLHSSPPARILRRSSFPSATVQKSNILQLSLPSCPASPFLFHKLLKEQSVAAATWRSAYLLAQLAGPAVAGRPARRTLAPPGGPLVLHRFRFLLSLGAVHPHRAKP